MSRLAAFLVAAAIFGTVCSASANVAIKVDKSTQRMTVSVEGARRYSFVVSTGRAGYGTPNGTYHPIRLERTWFSKEYYDSPMPHSIFFHGGYAIHGSYEISRLGGPASHGCVRLHPSDATKLYALVEQQGIGKTTITVTGENPSGRPGVESVQEEPDGSEPEYERPSRPDSYGNQYERPGWQQDSRYGDQDRWRYRQIYDPYGQPRPQPPRSDYRWGPFWYPESGR